MNAVPPKPDPLDNINVLIINYKTPNLTLKCAQSFLSHYPTVKVLLIDNGSNDASIEVIQQLAQQHDSVNYILNDSNLHHGPAMHQGIVKIKTPFLFTLDSDSEVTQAGFLEEMLVFFADPRLYATGRLQHKNKLGYPAKYQLLGHVKYIAPNAMLLDREKYLSLPFFTYHGAPCLKNMATAEKIGYKVREFPIEDFINHHGRGTCSRYGYALGPRSYFDHFVNKILQIGPTIDLPPGARAE